jgi:hypothetical protein
LRQRLYRGEVPAVRALLEEGHLQHDAHGRAPALVVPGRHQGLLQFRQDPQGRHPLGQQDLQGCRVLAGKLEDHAIGLLQSGLLYERVPDCHLLREHALVDPDRIRAAGEHPRRALAEGPAQLRPCAFLSVVDLLREGPQFRYLLSRLVRESKLKHSASASIRLCACGIPPPASPPGRGPPPRR